MTNFTDGNVTWLRDRADGIRRKDRPKTPKEWDALATGLDMIADSYCKLASVALEAVATVDVLTEPSKEDRIEH